MSTPLLLISNEILEAFLQLWLTKHFIVSSLLETNRYLRSSQSINQSVNQSINQSINPYFNFFSGKIPALPSNLSTSLRSSGRGWTNVLHFNNNNNNNNSSSSSSSNNNNSNNNNNKCNKGSETTPLSRLFCTNLLKEYNNSSNRWTGEDLSKFFDCCMRCTQATIYTQNFKIN